MWPRAKEAAPRAGSGFYLVRLFAAGGFSVRIFEIASERALEVSGKHIRPLDTANRGERFPTRVTHGHARPSFTRIGKDSICISAGREPNRDQVIGIPSTKERVGTIALVSSGL